MRYRGNAVLRDKGVAYSVTLSTGADVKRSNGFNPRGQYMTMAPK
jgi:hypothetical protein